MQYHEAQMTPQQLAATSTSRECRTDLGRVSDPKVQALFETTAEVLGGLCKALSDYQQGSEAIWRSYLKP